jgi:hypothetical protein
VDSSSRNGSSSGRQNGERATTEIHQNEDSKGVSKLKSDAKAGGDIAGGARKKLEDRLGRSIVTKKNFLK